MSPHTTRLVRLPRLKGTAVGITTALALTACGGQTGSDSGKGTPQGVVSQAAAKKIADHYEEVNNKANAARDEKLLGTVEAGQVYAMDKATYTLFETWPEKEQKAYAKPFSYRGREYVIPRKGTATWFAVRAKSSENSKNSVLLVFDKVGGTYKMVLSLWADGEEPPKLAVDRHGLAEAVDPRTQVGKLAPSGLGAAYEDFLETGGKDEGTALTSTEPVENAKKTYQRSSTKGAADGMATEKFFAKPPADPSVYALRTADGGVLALFPAAHKQESLLKEAYRSNAALVPNDEQSALGATRGVLITDVFEGQGLAELTPKSARITAVDFQHVDAR
ncbi:hypothetical protein AB0E64_05455 [Streptomyces caelestis]|uniref:DUF8094 domain-containing protein n=1 Tax=Streptomyces caelestis TaxID=36816 RepID=A0A7W9H8S8_9ACTN|nr:hypothetical protein [Streptomyces caelestis]MBB5797491.1 hypothetical protein [Streptomyces caelestis]GGW38492.1 putative lipoprotein [Streptomyces caelestis]